MSKNLVIVESPAKAKTIEKFLGSNFTVKSCNGHVRDLHPNELSIDIKNNFEPKYFVLDEKKKLIHELKNAVKNSETVWLATDEDREGEAISWHLYQELECEQVNTKRIVFHEITKNAILKAIETPRFLDFNLVNAQQARRVIDRLVGYQVSPVLWKKVKPGLSAGRVQSVAVRLIVEREREINNFIPQSFVKVTSDFTKAENETIKIKAELVERLADIQVANEFLKECKASIFTVESIEKKPGKRVPAPPFTTSTLQQEASRKLGFSVSQTMQIAQKLYEAGHITYMRTDSVRLSDLAIGTVKQEIIKQFGENYSQPRHFQTKSKSAQEAHEAIRPTYINKKKTEASTQENKLYELIWKRTVASQMADALVEKTIVKINISNSKRYFSAFGEVINFDGFLKLYTESFDDDTLETGESILPSLKEGEKLELKIATATERFTRPALRYTEAALVKKLEELGIGRPSTYAPTITTILKRDYILKGNVQGKERLYKQLVLNKGNITELENIELYGFDKGKLLPSPIGALVTDFLVSYFEKILDYNFTANIEDDFDRIAEGSYNWNKMVQLFYNDFTPVLETAEKALFKTSFERKVGVDPTTGKNVYAKLGKFGPYVQLGENTDTEKAKNARLKKGQLPENISLEEALELFKIPRTLGQHENKDIVVNIGKFGPYLECGGKNFAIPRKVDPYTINYEDAVAIIKAKIESGSNIQLPVFEIDGHELKVLRGRFGPYISYRKVNYKIPKGTQPDKLDLETCLNIVNSQDKPAKIKAKKK